MGKLTKRFSDSVCMHVCKSLSLLRGFIQRDFCVGGNVRHDVKHSAHMNTIDKCNSIIAQCSFTHVKIIVAM